MKKIISLILCVTVLSVVLKENVPLKNSKRTRMLAS